ncbi:MAG: hypothetical protein IE889_06915, partial [Campylobacterales bacterium]|nr:hypothetical protein [Campylobacterales bacterium]
MSYSNNLSSTGVFDRTPQLFGAGGDFSDITDDPVKVFAVEAVDAFYFIEIEEVVSI